MLRHLQILQTTRWHTLGLWTFWQLLCPRMGHVWLFILAPKTCCGKHGGLGPCFCTLTGAEWGMLLSMLFTRTEVESQAAGC